MYGLTLHFMPVLDLCVCVFFFTYFLFVCVCVLLCLVLLYRRMVSFSVWDLIYIRIAVDTRLPYQYPLLIEASDSLALSCGAIFTNRNLKPLWSSGLLN